ncbi:MAG: M6 family metalloprotease domain-containing protein [Marinilabiliaceae bacterium]|nr:M6 family metalloprotease domain-containing protein [Marinilabiliaceae bacterium]
MKNIYLFFLIAIFFVGFQASYGIGVIPTSKKIKQPDGSLLTIKQHGDEFYNWVTTIDGYRIVQNSEGIFEYAVKTTTGNIVTSGIKVSDVQNRNSIETDFLSKTVKNLGVSKQNAIAKKAAMLQNSKLKSTTDITQNHIFPHSGSFKLLVVLANFSDTEPTYSQVDFNNLMNQPDYQGTGSFRDYYLENSNNKLELNSVVVQWVKLSKAHDYYGADNKSGEFVFDALTAANNAGVDFSQFDNNGDGLVENVLVIHQGKGEEGSSNIMDIWSHYLYLSAFGYSKAERTFDGVVIDDYTISPEFYGNETSISTIGVICHEFGHSLGAPDYYDVNGATEGNHDGTGYWDLMAYGAYNEQGRRPAHHNPLSKQQFGWIDVEILENEQHITVEPIIFTHKAYRYNTTSDKEFFLLENRVFSGSDVGIPGEGLLIYHVDSNYIASHIYGVNNTDHQGLYIKAAGGATNSSSCPFPGLLGVTEFTDTTDPSSLAWNQNSTNKSVTGIFVNGNNIEFDFMALQNGAPLSFATKVMSYDSIMVKWTRSSENYPVLVASSVSNTFGNPVGGHLYSVGDTIEGGGNVLYYGDSIDFIYHDSLTELTTYYYQIWSDRGISFSVPLTSYSTTISGPVLNYPWYDDFENGIIKWKNERIGEGVVDWVLNEGGYGIHPANAHSGNQNAYFYSDLEGTKGNLISPLFKVDSTTQSFRIEFYHAQEDWYGDQDYLRVLYRLKDSLTWIPLGNYVSSIAQWKEEKLDFTPGGDFEIAFEAQSNYGYGVVIDDVNIFPHQTNPPVNSSTNFTVKNSTKTSLTISWTPGDGDRYLVVGKLGSPVSGLPDDYTAYLADTLWGMGDETESDEFVLSVSDTSQITVAGLLSSSTYYFAIFDFFSSNLNYQLNALNGSAQTLYGKSLVRFSVVDEHGESLADANISIGEYSALTNENGYAEMSTNVSGSFTNYKIEKNGYDLCYGKFIGNDTVDLSAQLFGVNVEAVIDTVIHDYNDVTVKWNPFIYENFTGYEPFALTIPNWTFYDGDTSETYGLYGDDIAFPNEGYVGSFIVINPYVKEGFEIPEHSFVNDQFLGCVASDHVPNNDWIISPVLHVNNEMWLSFVAKSSKDDYGLERIRVLVSESGSSDLDSFKLISSGDYLEVPVNWSCFKYDLSPYLNKNIRFAINCVSNDAYLLLLDKIMVSNAEPLQFAPVFNKAPSNYCPLNTGFSSIKEIVTFAPQMQKSNSYSSNISYELYRNENLVSTVNGMSNTEYIDSGLVCNTYNYQVKAVLKSPVIENISGVQSISICNTVFVVVQDAEGYLQGANVVFNNTSQLTNSDGSVVFENVENGDVFDLEVSLQNYLSEKIKISVVKDTVVNVILESSSQIEESGKLMAVVYPNPTSGLINVKLPVLSNEVEYKIVNAAGQIVQQRVVENNFFLVDITYLTKGLYMIEISGDEYHFVLKIFKE